MKRIFFPGEEWLYIRLYLGPETAESWLSDVFPLLLNELEIRKLITRCFYIRYSDPDFHLRIRFELGKAEYLTPVLQELNKSSEDLLKLGLIWKTEIGTYHREIERYGEDWIESAEDIFTVDTKFWLKILPELRYDPNGEDKRWQASLLSAHGVFNEFDWPLYERISLLGKMVETLSAENGGGKRLKLQIDAKFRKSRVYLEEILFNPTELEIPGLSRALSDRMEMIKRKDSINLDINSWDEGLKRSRISDIIHMSLNRGLRSKHRMQEEIIYTFLRQLYISAEARGLSF